MKKFMIVLVGISTIVIIISLISCRKENNRKDQMEIPPTNLKKSYNQLFFPQKESKFNYDSLMTSLNKEDLSCHSCLESLLKKVYLRDQEFRDSLMAIDRKGDEWKSTSFWKKIMLNDEINKEIVKYILINKGYPDTRKMDSKAHDAIWYTLFHNSDREFLTKSLDYLKFAHNDSIISSQDYTLLVDQIYVRCGKKQIYGTYNSFRKSGNGIIFPKISQSIDSINYHRELIGLVKIK
ncbi:hypothetical protein [uncultured Imperialibacter sp.]|uniref:hypothetical protein n=1 Tax=uncultured Imperialibacter sp. TaxID=1672639 RepID=UPI0030D71BA7|tara:strand:+ start:2763 stop:3473 length:711 start_codon:yes stop_codon:yes gene_type:complete